MKRQHKRRARSTPPSPDKPDGHPRRNYARWRAATLTLVYVLFAIHMVHWKLSGQTLAPLELNEVMYTLEMGIITAGFLFMCFLLLGTLIFGRFFCSWACHIIALQDLCAWILRKFGIRRKPIRSRLLLLVPPLTAFYMFIWPQILRTWRNRAFPEFHFRTDVEGWASFATTDFWRNLPGPWVILLTFVVCGFIIVYLLGSRTFCTYVCPYGAIFGLADRFAPGRIRVSNACQQCATCTAACTSGVRVHEEVNRHGMIVNPACLKDFDCVGACPQKALHYSFGKPSLFKSFKSGGRFGRLPYDYSLIEDIWIGAVFLAVVFIFRGLYGAVPFLMALALGTIIAYVSVPAGRLYRCSEVKLASFSLKTSGRLRPSGYAFAASFVLLVLFVGHSAFIRYHEFSGLRLASVAHSAADPEQGRAAAQSALPHLSFADRRGLFTNERVERSLMEVSLQLSQHDTVEHYAQRLLERHPADAHARFVLGQSYAANGQFVEAERQLRAVIAQYGNAPYPVQHILASAHQALGGLFVRQGEYAAAAGELRAAIELDPRRPAVHAELGSVLAELGQFEAAIESLQEAARLDPNVADTHYNLGTILGHLRRFQEAVPCYGRALELAPDNALIHNNLGFALLRLGELERSQEHLERAITIEPNNSDAHFNLANVFALQGRPDQANEHYHIAADLDPRYAEILRNSSK